MIVILRLLGCRLTWVAVCACASLLCPDARAEQPFFYYPAYGAQRGRIVYRDGLLVNRTRVHWGNGLTPYGASVLNNAIAAAGPILTTVLKEPSNGEGQGRDRAAHERSLRDDDALLNGAQQLRARNQELARAFGLTQTNGGAASGGGDGFQNWDNAGPGAAPATPAAGPFHDWDNSGAASPTPAASGSFSDWDNR